MTEQTADTLPPMAEVLESEDQILAFTHTKRKQIVSLLLKDNKLPDDVDQQRLVLTTLKDMDSAALTRKRIKVDEKANDNTAEAASLIARVLERVSPSKTHTAKSDVSSEPPVLGKEVADPVLVQDETATALAQGNYENFMAENR